jgi:hypothetical protein
MMILYNLILQIAVLSIKPSNPKGRHFKLFNSSNQALASLTLATSIWKKFIPQAPASLPLPMARGLDCPSSKPRRKKSPSWLGTYPSSAKWRASMRITSRRRPRNNWRKPSKIGSGIFRLAPTPNPITCPTSHGKNLQLCFLTKSAKEK